MISRLCSQCSANASLLVLLSPCPGCVLAVALAHNVTEFVFECLFRCVTHTFDKYPPANEGHMIRLEGERVVRDEPDFGLPHQRIPHIFVAYDNDLPVGRIGQVADDFGSRFDSETASVDGLGAGGNHGSGSSWRREQ